MSQWTRTDRIPCRVCGRKGWCSDGGDVVHCMRVVSDHPVKSGGWIHRLGCGSRPLVSAACPTGKLTPARLAELQRDYQSRLAAGNVASLAGKLGVSACALRRLGIGQDGSAFTFPMFDGGGKLIGIHRRFSDGNKRCLTGSKLGLFIPDGINPATPLLICEGASDTAAALTFQLAAIGIPSAGQGFDHVAGFIARCNIDHVIVVADLDSGSEPLRGEVTWPGIESALKLAERLIPLIRKVQAVLPPDRVKDLRQWIGMADAENIRAAIASSPIVHPAWLRQAWQNVAENRHRRREAANLRKSDIWKGRFR